MDTYTKQHRYLDAFDISAYLEQIDSALYLITESMQRNISGLKASLRRAGVSEGMAEHINQDLIALHLVSGVVYNLLQECDALANRSDNEKAPSQRNA